HHLYDCSHFYSATSLPSFSLPPSPLPLFSPLFFFNDPPTPEIYTLSLHDALPIFVVAQIDFTDRRERIAGDGKDGDRSLRPVGDQREGPGAIDRHACGTPPRLQLRRHLGRGGLEIDHRELVVGGRFLRIGRIDLGSPGDERETLVARDRYAQRRADNAGRGRDLGDDLGRRRIEIDHRDGIRGRIGWHRIYAVDENGLPVIGRERKLAAGSRR